MNETKSREEIELLKSWTNFINEDGNISIKIDSYMNLIYTVKSLLIKKLLPIDEFEVLERLNKNLKNL